jgi:hypothetical protein
MFLPEGWLRHARCNKWRDYAILMMLAKRGLRADEVATLTLDDIRADTVICSDARFLPSPRSAAAVPRRRPAALGHVPEIAVGSGRAPRRVELPPQLCAVERDWRLWQRAGMGSFAETLGRAGGLPGMQYGEC